MSGASCRSMRCYVRENFKRENDKNMPTPDGTPLQGGVYDPRNENAKEPDMVLIEKTELEFIYETLALGAEYAKEVVVEHDKQYGRDTIKNKKAALQTESDVETILAGREIAAKYLG